MLQRLRSRTFLKRNLQFSGANKLHQSFIRSIATIATRANELLVKRDNEIPQHINSLVLQQQKIISECSNIQARVKNYGRSFEFQHDQCTQKASLIVKKSRRRKAKY